MQGAVLQQMFRCLVCSIAGAQSCLSNALFVVEMVLHAVVAGSEAEDSHLFLPRQQVIRVFLVVLWVLLQPL